MKENELKVHVILNESDTGVIEAIKEIDGLIVTQIDYSLDSAYYWLEKPENDIDIIVTSEFVSLSTFHDGKRMSKSAAFLKKISSIRLLKPRAKIVVFCAEERDLPENREFLESLVAVGIYDFYLVTQLSHKILKDILLAPPRDISQVKEYLPGVDLPKTEQSIDGYIDIESEKEASFFAEKAKKITKSLKDVLNYKGLKKSKPIVTENGLYEQLNLDSAENERKEQYVRNFQLEKVLNIYGYKLTEIFPDVINFDDWALLLKAAETVYPDIVIFNSESGIKDKIDMLSCTTVVLGEPTEDTINADYHFSNWNEQAKAKICTPKEQADPLTGLFGRSTLKTVSYNLLKSKTPFSLAICDLDYFKKVNDTYGHQKGDEVLRVFAQFLKQNIRNSDTVVRYGGEEFVIIFPGTVKKEAAYVMQKIRQLWKNHDIYNITFSAGIAAYPEDGNTFNFLFKLADDSLYKAKKTGRDQIIAFSGPEFAEKVFVLSKNSARVWAVVGAAPRVGATSFALLLAGYLKNYNVEILDAGGGAYQRLRGPDIPLRKVPPYSVAPGITIVDCGTFVPQEIIPLAEKIFIVTDLSDKATNIRDLTKLNSNVYLVGNRNAPVKETRELAEVWGIEYFCSLKEDPSLRTSEMTKSMPSFQKHKKELAKIRRFVS